MPEPPGSAQAKVTVTSVLFQPLALAAGARLPPIVGAVRSILTGALVVVVQLPARSQTVVVAVRPRPLPLMTLSAGQPPAMPERASAQVQWTVTSPLYQPLAFGLVVGVP